MAGNYQYFMIVFMFTMAANHQYLMIVFMFTSTYSDIVLCDDGPGSEIKESQISGNLDRPAAELKESTFGGIVDRPPAKIKEGQPAGPRDMRPGTVQSKRRLQNVSQTIEDLLNGYDVRLRPQFGGEIWKLGIIFPLHRDF